MTEYADYIVFEEPKMSRSDAARSAQYSLLENRARQARLELRDSQQGDDGNISQLSRKGILCMGISPSVDEAI